MTEEVEHFHGVYLLCSLNPSYKGRTYIGYTVNPSRRIKQHNAGSQAGGAWRTSGRGPWEMVLIIHGFPNNISALQFEWAWQHPDKCRRLRDAAVLKRRSETALQHRWRTACHLLRVGPWHRLALTIRWLKQDYKLDFPVDLLAPVHMPVCYGPLISRKLKSKSETSTSSSPKKLTETADDMENEEGMTIPCLVRNNHVCTVCLRKLEPDDKQFMCYMPACSMVGHIVCLAKQFIGSTETGQLVPVKGSCPGCRQTLLWGDLVRHYRRRCQTQSQNDLGSHENRDIHWKDDET